MYNLIRSTKLVRDNSASKLWKGEYSHLTCRDGVREICNICIGGIYGILERIISL